LYSGLGVDYSIGGLEMTLIHIVAIADGKPYHAMRDGNGQWAPFAEITGEFAAGPIPDTAATPTSPNNPVLGIKCSVEPLSGDLHVLAILANSIISPVPGEGLKNLVHTRRRNDAAGQWDRWDFPQFGGLGLDYKLINYPYEHEFAVAPTPDVINTLFAAARIKQPLPPP
jgi:hypothetical protein